MNTVQSRKKTFSKKACLVFEVEGNDLIKVWPNKAYRNG